MTVGRHDKEFTSYLQSKNLSLTTQQAYLRYLNRFISWYGKDLLGCSKKDILDYLTYLKNKKNQQSITRRNALIALNHYFALLIENEQLTSNPTAFIKLRGTHKRILYNNYSTDQLTALWDNYYQTFIRTYDDSHIPKNQRQQRLLSCQRNYVLLGLLIYQGLNTNELQSIELADIDLNRATVQVKGGKKSNDRTLPLKAEQIGSLMHYIQQVRPQFFMYRDQTEHLFYAMPESSKRITRSENLMNVFKPLSKQLRSIDQQFLNLLQIRSSVITNWLKTEGLRKTQYLAGHRYISSTEKYLAGELESLSEDLSKYNPFS